MNGNLHNVNSASNGNLGQNGAKRQCEMDGRTGIPHVVCRHGPFIFCGFPVYARMTATRPALSEPHCRLEVNGLKSFPLTSCLNPAAKESSVRSDTVLSSSYDYYMHLTKYKSIPPQALSDFKKHSDNCKAIVSTVQLPNLLPAPHPGAVAKAAWCRASTSSPL